MDRKYADYEAKNGPLFQRIKHKDRLNLEDASLTSLKWTTQMCHREVEALPIILEKDEDEHNDHEEIDIANKNSESDDLVASLLETVLTDIGGKRHSQGGSDEDFSCIFSKNLSSAQSSSTSVPETEFQTMFKNETFPKIKRRTFREPSDSSSDDEMDDYFKFQVNLPRKKIDYNIQSTKAKTELVASEKPSKTSSTTKKETKKFLPGAGTSTKFEVVLGTMEADFSDAYSEERLLSTSRRMVHPLSLRYSAEEVDDASVKVLRHATSLMNLPIDKVSEISEDILVSDMGIEDLSKVEVSCEAKESASRSKIGKEREKLSNKPSRSTEMPIFPTQSPSKKQTPELQGAAGAVEKSKKKHEKAKMSSTAWWKSMARKTKTDKKPAIDEEPSNDSPKK